MQSLIETFAVASSTKAPGLPFVGPPLVGASLDMWRRPFDCFVGPYVEHGPVFRTRLGGRSLTVLAGPEDAKLLTKDAHGQYLSNGETWRLYSEAVGSEVLPGLDGRRHVKQRSLQMYGFSRQAFLARLPEMNRLAMATFAELETGREYSVLGLVRRLIYRQLAALTLGRDADAIFDDLLYYNNTLLSVAVLRAKPSLLLRTPRYRRAKRRVEAFADTIIEERKTRHPAPRDLAGDIIAAHRKGEDFQSLEALRVGLTGPLVAGLDTAANTICYALYALLLEPGLARRVRGEVRGVLSERPLDEVALKAMPTLHGLILETLRRYPIASVIMREAAVDFEFCGHEILAGESLLLAAPVAHFLPKFYPEPYVFDIDRFAAPRREHTQRYAFSPYGGGAHICLGARLAEVQIMLLLARILYQLAFVGEGPLGRLRTRFDPAPTLGDSFRIRLLGKRGVRSSGD